MDPTRTPGPARPQALAAPLSRADAAWALAVCAAAWALYAATFQARQYGDAALLVQVFVKSLAGEGQWGHVLYIPCAKALARALPLESPIEGLRQLSALGGALACAGAFLLARLWGADRGAALWGAALFAFSPALWFFSTTVEVHTLHAACVGLCSVVAILAPWRVALAGALLSAAFLPLLFFSHQSGILLGPGFVLLAQWARVHSGARAFSRAALWLVIAPLFLSAFLAAIAFAADQLDNSIAGFLGGTNETVRTYDQELEARNAWDGWILPLGMLLPVFVVAAARRRLAAGVLGVVLGLIAPSLAFFLVWSLPERGGYALPTALFLAAAGARALEGRSRALRALAVATVALQAALGWSTLRGYDEPQWRERNAARGRAVAEVLPDGGALISINVHSQYIEYQLHRVREVSLYQPFAMAASEGLSPEAFVQRVEPQLVELLESGQALAWDREGREIVARLSPTNLRLIDGLEAWLAARCRLEPSRSAPEQVLGLRREEF